MIETEDMIEVPEAGPAPVDQAVLNPTQAEIEEYKIAAKRVLERDNSPTFDQLSSLGVFCVMEFQQAEHDRLETEQRWLRDLRQYRGKYDPDVEAKLNGRSKAFVRKTRVKVKTLDARMLDMLFPANAERNWAIKPTPVPTLPGEMESTLVKILAAALKREPTDQEHEQAVKSVVEDAARKMGDEVADQLAETQYRKVCKKVLHAGHVYGTGVLKGPLVERRQRRKYVAKGGKWELVTEEYVRPFLDYVPVWRFYPDMSATDIENARYVYERHILTRAALIELASGKRFNKKAIIDYVTANRDGSVRQRQFDNELRSIGDREAIQWAKAGQYEVIERWGWLSGEQLKEVGLDIPQERCHEQFFANVWFLPDGTVIKAVLSPIRGVDYPYHLYYVDKDETSLFGEGIPSIMRDDQEMLNAATRMMLDNAAITAGSNIEVNTRLIDKRDDPRKISAWKVWLRSGESPGTPAVRVLDFPSHIDELLKIAEVFEANGDEITGVPRYMAGENVTNGAGSTMGGLSMLMAASSIIIKDQVVSWDEGITTPFVTALYRWNMQFNQRGDIKGDFDVVARGASSLVAKEVKGQQIAQYAGTMQPEERAFIKWDNFARQRAEILEMSDLVKTKEEVEQEQNSEQAKQAAAMQQQLGELQVRLLAANVGKAEAQIGDLIAKAKKTLADTVEANVRAVYAAMQAAGVAVSAPHIAPAGDEIWRTAGGQDATPQQDTAGTAGAAQGVSPMQQPTPPAGEVAPLSPVVGSEGGIETAAIEGMSQ